MNETKETRAHALKNAETLIDGLDFYFEDGLMVLTRRYLLNRGFCCKNGCRHCPYENAASDPLE